MDIAMIQSILALSAGLLLASSLPGSCYLALLTWAGILPPRLKPTASLSGRIGIVVPAHNEASVIARTVTNLLPIALSDGHADVVVIADNCDDDTDKIAQQCGARVLVRHDEQQRGKGHALCFAFDLLMKEDYTAFVVIDADSIADPHFLSALRKTLSGTTQAAQARYTVLNGSATPRTRLAEIALAAFNVLRPRARERLGLSVGILGNGFALRREVLMRVPYSATSVVEDLEYHLKLVAAGIRVAFIDDGLVRGEMPTGNEGSITQRSRWEGGRLRMLKEHGPSLLRAVMRGKGRFADPLLDLLLLPLGYHVMILLLALFLALVSGSLPLLGLAVISIAIVGLHVLAARRVAGLPWTHLQVLLTIPSYLFWKLRVLTATLSTAQRHSNWIRTNRRGD